MNLAPISSCCDSVLKPGRWIRRRPTTEEDIAHYFLGPELANAVATPSEISIPPET